MINKVYSIRDIKAEEYGPLFVAKNDEVAMRMIKNTFGDLVFPQDYELFCVGDFDTEEGKLMGYLDIVCNLLSIFEPIEDASKYVPVLGDFEEND